MPAEPIKSSIDLYATDTVHGVNDIGPYEDLVRLVDVQGRVVCALGESMMEVSLSNPSLTITHPGGARAQAPTVIANVLRVAGMHVDGEQTSDFYVPAFRTLRYGRAYADVLSS